MLFYISPYPTESNTRVLSPSFDHKPSVCDNAVAEGNAIATQTIQASGEP